MAFLAYLYLYLAFAGRQYTGDPHGGFSNCATTSSSRIGWVNVEVDVIFGSGSDPDIGSGPCVDMNMDVEV